MYVYFLGSLVCVGQFVGDNKKPCCACLLYSHSDGLIFKINKFSTKNNFIFTIIEFWICIM